MSHEIFFRRTRISRVGLGVNRLGFGGAFADFRVAVAVEDFRELVGQGLGVEADGDLPPDGEPDLFIQEEQTP